MTAPAARLHRTAWRLAPTASVLAHDPEGRCPRYHHPARSVLIEHLIRAFSLPGELVADLFPLDEVGMTTAQAFGRGAVACAPDPAMHAALAQTLAVLRPGEGVHELGVRGCTPEDLPGWLPADHREVGLVLLQAEPDPDACTDTKTCPACRGGLHARPGRLRNVIGAARTILAPGGVLAVITGASATPFPVETALAFVPGRPVLLYRQHVTVLWEPRAEAAFADAHSPGEAAIAVPARSPVVAEVHLFTQPHPTPPPPRLEAPQMEVHR